VTRCPRSGRPLSEPGPCGTQIDRYKVERLLGTGAFGSVYKAHHARTRSEVAFKVLRPELMTNATILERFLREATTAASVGSEHVVRVVDAEVTAENVAFIAMEYVEGEDLKSLMLGATQLHPARAVGLLCQLLEGLSAAHDKGIVHRDIKPANLLVARRRDVHGREQEVVKILDFGISKVAGAAALTGVGVTIGTPSYMAWEQFTDSRAVDARSDLYAVAAIAHELLTGRKPFDADDIPGLIERMRTHDRPKMRDLMPGLPVPLCAVVEKGLEKRQERRWQTAREFERALEATLQLLDAPPPLAPRVREPEPATPAPAPDVQRDVETRVRLKDSAQEPTEKG